MYRLAGTTKDGGSNREGDEGIITRAAMVLSSLPYEKVPRSRSEGGRLACGRRL